jgi:hypothetical protein
MHDRDARLSPYQELAKRYPVMRSTTALLLAVLAAWTSGCATARSSEPGPLGEACKSPAHREIRLVRRSNAFEEALKGIATVAPGAEWRDFSGWRCQQMHREILGGFQDLSVVRTIAIDGIEQRDVYFGLVGREVVILNPWVVQPNGAHLDTTAWNGFVRTRSGIRLQTPRDYAVMNCVLVHVAGGYPSADTCKHLHHSTSSVSTYSIRSDGSVSGPGRLP